MSRRDGVQVLGRAWTAAVAVAIALGASGCSSAGGTTNPPDFPDAATPARDATTDARKDSAATTHLDAGVPDATVDVTPPIGDAAKDVAAARPETGAETGAVDARVDAGCTSGPGLQSDPANCGYCGHGCQGGACVTGMCQPVLVAAVGCGGLALSATDAYVAGGLVAKISLDGGVVTTLGGGDVFVVTLASTGLYMTSDQSQATGTIVRTGLDGGAFVTLASAPNTGGTLAVDSQSVYWEQANALTDAGALLGDASHVFRMPLDGGVVTAVASLAATSGVSANVAVDARYAYFTDDDGNLLKAPLQGGAVTTLATEDIGYAQVAVDSRAVYWFGDDFLRAQETPLQKVGLDGGVVTTLVAEEPQQILEGFAVDSTGVYWITYGTAGQSDGVVARVGLDGGASTILASGQTNPWAVAVNATTVYWTDCNVGLMKVAKP